MSLHSQTSRAYTAAAIVVMAACTRTRQEVPPAGSEALGDSGPSAAHHSEDDESVRPVYPLDGVSSDPAAVRLCAALQERPQTRLAECRATTPGVLMTRECIRTLSAALHLGAVSLEVTDVDRCADAADRALAGCAWADRGAPEPPAECEGIVHGALAAGARCRSSLECLDGLRCHGAGPTSAGQCGPPRDDGSTCGGSVDTLAVYVRQDHYDARHPECRGWCSGRKCMPRTASRQSAAGTQN
jgi:hypothetical protein